MEPRQLWWKIAVRVYDGLNVHARVQRGKVQERLEPCALDPRAGDGAKLKRSGVVNP